MKKDSHKKTKDAYGKLKNQLEYLTFANEYTKNIKEVLQKDNLWVTANDVTYGSHTLLKLSYIKYYLDIALTIACERFKKCVFIDTLAGSGIVKVKDTEYASLGSSLLALIFNTNKNKHFNKIVSIEIDEKRVELLKKRIKRIKDQGFGQDVETQTIIGDITKDSILNIVANEINTDDYGLLFIDPEGLEVDLDKFAKIVQRSKYLDIILNESSGINRILGKANKGDKSSLEILGKYNSAFKKANNPDQAREKLFELFGKPLETVAEIRDENNKVMYKIVLRVRQTKSGTKWINPMSMFAKNVINKYNGKDVKNILDQIHKKNSQLDSFL